MYCEFYQLTERPFNVTPDPKFLYLNARYREAIASLNYGISQRKGFITLIGEAGTGKTTLLKKLLEDLDSKTKSVFIFNTNVTFEEILEYIFAEFDLPVHNGRKLYMLQRLNTFLLEELRGGGNVALLIDEAQDLEFSVLEDLRLLSNLETTKEKILQIVLSGQPELGQKLSNPVLRQLRQRIGINCRLLPLSRDEITEYIHFRLQAAGCADLKLFTREAEDQIYHFSRGIPRLVNVVCDNALVIGYALGKRRIGADVIAEAAADLLPAEAATEAPNEPVGAASVHAPHATSAPLRWRPRLGLVGLVVAAVVIGLWSVGRTMLDRRADEPYAFAPPAKLEVIRPGSQPNGSGIDHPSATGHGVRDDAAATEPIAAAPIPAALDEPHRPLSAAPPSVERGGSAPGEVAPGAVEAGHLPPTGERAELERREPVARPEMDRHEASVDARRPEHSAPVIDVAAAVPPKRPAAADAAEPTDGRSPLEHDETDAAETTQPKQMAAVEPLKNPTPAFVAAAAEPPHAPGFPRLDGIKFGSFVVRDGDSMSEIARRKYGQSSYTVLDLLKLANPELDDIDLISTGQTIRVPELNEGFPVLNDGNGRYALLIFSTPNLNRATNLQKALVGRGFDARVTTASIGSQTRVLRVVVAGFPNRDQVAGVGRELQKLFREDTRLAQLGE